MCAVVAPDAARPRLGKAFQAAVRAARRRPSFALYLVALLALPVKWFSPFAHAQAGLADLFVAACAIAWAAGHLRAGTPIRLRAVHWFGVSFLGLAALSALIASEDRSTGAEGVLIMAELATLAVLTSDFARDPERRSAIVLAILVAALVTGVEVVAGLALFYAGTETSLVHGWLTERSDDYARMSAGFYSAPLMGSFCVFASAVLARDDTGIPASWRRAGQAALALSVLFSLSRAIIAFGLAFVLRAAHRRGTRRAWALAAAATAMAVLAMVGLTVTRVSLDPADPLATEVTVPLDEGRNDRLQEVTSSSETLAEHPVLGTGPNSYPATNAGQPFRAHLTPLNIAATLGLPALAALVGLIAALWRSRRRPTDAATWSGLAGLGVESIGQDIEHFRHVWILLGLADADRRAERPAEPAVRDRDRADQGVL